MAVGQHTVCVDESWANMDSPVGGRVHSDAKIQLLCGVGKSITDAVGSSTDHGESLAL